MRGPREGVALGAWLAGEGVRKSRMLVPRVILLEGRPFPQRLVLLIQIRRTLTRCAKMAGEAGFEPALLSRQINCLLGLPVPPLSNISPFSPLVSNEGIPAFASCSSSKGTLAFKSRHSLRELFVQLCDILHGSPVFRVQLSTGASSDRPSEPVRRVPNAISSMLSHCRTPSPQ